MAKEKLEELSLEKLTRRKKFATIWLVVMLVVLIIDISLFLYDLIWDNNFNPGLLGTIGALIAVSAPILIVKKKINEELKRREDK